MTEQHPSPSAPLSPSSASTDPALPGGVDGHSASAWASTSGNEWSQVGSPAQAGAPAYGSPSAEHTGARPAATGNGASSSSRSTAHENFASRLFKSLIDFRFERSAVLEGAGIIYGLWIAFVVLNWLGTVLSTAIIGFQRFGGYYGDGPMVAPWLPVLVLLLGWIPALIWIVVGRVVLEFVFAGVRTARETVLIREHLEGRATDSPADAGAPTGTGGAFI